MSLLSYLGTCTFHTGQNSVIFTKENPLFLVYNLNPNAPKITFDWHFYPIVDRGALSHLYFIHKISTARVMNRVKIVEMHRFSIYFLAVIGHKKVLLGQARRTLNSREKLQSRLSV